jgi:hypothetical protein
MSRACGGVHLSDGPVAYTGLLNAPSPDNINIPIDVPHCNTARAVFSRAARPGKKMLLFADVCDRLRLIEITIPCSPSPKTQRSRSWVVVHKKGFHTGLWAAGAYE